MAEAVAEILAAVEAQGNPLTPADVRRRAHDLCEAFKRRPDSVECALFLLNHPPAQASDGACHFAMHVLQVAIRHRWNAWPDSAKLQLRDSLLQLAAAVGRPRARFLREKHARLLAEVAKREFPQRWPEFLGTLLALDARGGEQAEVAWLCLAQLTEDIADADFHSEVPAPRRRDVMQGINALFPDIYRAAYATASRAYAAFHAAGGAEAQATPAADLLRAAVSAVVQCVPWVHWPGLVLGGPPDEQPGAGQNGSIAAGVPPPARQEPVGSFPQVCCALVVDAALPEGARLAAHECLLRVLRSSRFCDYGHVSPGGARLDSTSAARAAHVVGTVGAAATRLASATALDPDNHAEWLALAELVVALGAHHLEPLAVVCLAPKPAIDVAPSQVTLQATLTLALSLLADHPSPLVGERVLSMWLGVAKGGNWRNHAAPLLHSLVPPLLAALGGRLREVGDPDNDDYEADPASAWSAEHFADSAEWRIWRLHQFLPRIGIVVRMLARWHGGLCVDFAVREAEALEAQIRAAAGRAEGSPGAWGAALDGEVDRFCSLLGEIVGGILPAEYSDAAAAAAAMLLEAASPKGKAALAALARTPAHGAGPVPPPTPTAAATAAAARAAAAMAAGGGGLSQQAVEHVAKLAAEEEKVVRERSALAARLAALLARLGGIAGAAAAAGRATPLGQLLQVISLFGPLLQAVPASLTAVLELLFSSLTFGEPSGLAEAAAAGGAVTAQLRRALAPSAAACRRIAVKALLRLCSGAAFASAALPLFNGLCSRASALVSGARLLEGERVLLQEALVAASLAIADTAQRAAFLQQVLDPVLGEWETGVAPSVASAATLVSSMQLQEGGGGTPGAAAGGAAEVRFEPNWAILNALNGLLSLGKRGAAAGESGGAVGGFTAAHWGRILPALLQLIGSLHAMWGDADVLGTAGVTPSFADAPAATDVAAQRGASGGAGRAALLRQRHARWLLTLTRDELLRIAGTESELAAATDAKAARARKGQSTQCIEAQIALIEGGRDPTVLGMGGWGSWGGGGWMEGAHATDGPGGDELASWSSRCRQSAYALLALCCRSCAVPQPPRPPAAPQRGNRLGLVLDTVQVAGAPPLPPVGFLLASLCGLEGLAPGFGGAAGASAMAHALHGCILAPLRTMEHRHLRMLLNQFFLPFTAAHSAVTGSPEVWERGFAPLMAPLLVHMEARLSRCWQAHKKRAAGGDAVEAGGGASAAASAAAAAEGEGVSSAWLPVLPIGGGTGAAAAGSGGAAAAGEGAGGPGPAERAAAARDRSLREVTIAHGQLLCGILVPGPMNNSVWGKVVPSPAARVGVGAAAERRAAADAARSFPLWLLRSRTAAAQAVLVPLLRTIAGLIGGNHWGCVESAAATSALYCLKHMLVLLGLDNDPDQAAGGGGKAAASAVAAAAAAAGGAEPPPVTEELLQFIGTELFVSMLLPLLNRATHVSGSYLQWELVSLIKDIYCVLVLQGRSPLPRQALATYAQASEAELGALDAALVAAAAPREGAAGKAGSRDKEQKNAMRDWLTALLLKRESAMHAAGIDVEGQVAHAAATGKAAGVGESVLKERQCLVQNLDHPVSAAAGSAACLPLPPLQPLPPPPPPPLLPNAKPLHSTNDLSSPFAYLPLCSWY